MANILVAAFSFIFYIDHIQCVHLNAMSFMQTQALAGSQAYLQQQSHNCNSNIDRLKKGPVDWTQIEGSGKSFSDKSFAADETMLSWKEYPRTVGGLAKYLSWFKDFKRPNQLMMNAKGPLKKVSLFGENFKQTGKLSAYDLEQGSVGNNYLLTVIAALAERGNFIPNMFHQTEYTDEGIFTIKVYVKGRPEDITIDDTFPIYSGRSAFAKTSVDKGWWLPLIEKAFAKVHVNYEMISSGDHAEAARFLTGSPSSEFVSNLQQPEEIWMKMKNALDNDFMITAACFNEWNGLVAGHGYIVKNYTVINGPDGNEIKLVKVRNPWKLIGDTSISGKSHGAWTGRYSSNKSTWTPELKVQAKLDSLEKGEFFMTIDDFRTGFKYYTITYMHKDWHSSYIEKRDSVNRRLYKFNFTIGDDTQLDHHHILEDPIHKDIHHQEVHPMQNDIPRENQNLMVSDTTVIPQHIEKQSKILSQLSQHLKESTQFLQVLGESSDLSDIMDLELESEISVGNQISDNDNDNANTQTEGEVIDTEEDMEEEKEKAIAESKKVEEVSKIKNQTKTDNQQQKKVEATVDTKKIILKPVQVSDIKKEQINTINNPIKLIHSEPENNENIQTDSFQAYIGGELYNKRMFPHGCPSYQKAFVKLFKVQRGRKKMTLVDTQFFNNRDGFGFIMRNLTRGEYQIQFKKYSQSFDVFDFTVRMYAQQQIKFIDDEEANIKKVKLSAAMIANIPKINEQTLDNPADKAAMPTNPNPAVAGAPVDPTSKVINQAIKKAELKEKTDAQPIADTNQQFRQPVGTPPDQQKQKSESENQPEKKEEMVPPAQTVKPLDAVQPSKLDQISKIELPKPIPKKLIASKVPQQAVQVSSHLSKQVLANKLNKAQKLANDSKNDKFFEIHKKEDYYMKDAMDKKHGFYFLRVGADNEKNDLNLKVMMFVKGDQLETSEDKEKVYQYKFAQDGDFKLTTQCNLRPQKGKKSCDFLVPTSHHDRTQIFVQRKLEIGKEETEAEIFTEASEEPVENLNSSSSETHSEAN